MRKDNGNNFSLSYILKIELQNFNINDMGNLPNGGKEYFRFCRNLKVKVQGSQLRVCVCDGLHQQLE